MHSLQKEKKIIFSMFVGLCHIQMYVIFKIFLNAVVFLVSGIVTAALQVKHVVTRIMCRISSCLKYCSSDSDAYGLVVIIISTLTHFIECV